MDLANHGKVGRYILKGPCIWDRMTQVLPYIALQIRRDDVVLSLAELLGKAEQQFIYTVALLHEFRTAPVALTGTNSCYSVLTADVTTTQRTELASPV